MPASGSSRNGTKRFTRAVEAVSISRFKSICAEQRLEFRPLTVLAGANSSGKSSIMQPLLLMKQTLEAPYDPGPLRLDGPNVRLTSTEQLMCRVAGCADAGGFTVRFELPTRRSLQVSYGRVAGQGVRVESMTLVDGRETTVFREGLSAGEVEKLVHPDIRKMREHVPPRGSEKPEWVVHRERCFLFLGLRYPKGGQDSVVGFWPSLSPATMVLPFLENLIHLPGLRGNPERTYATSAVGGSFPGTFQTYVASVVFDWQSRMDRRIKQLGKDLMTLDLTWKVEAKPVDETRVELRVGRLPRSRRGGAHDLVSIADVGFGVSQALPVVVALLAATPGQVVYVEQPEIHLHPRAQTSLATLLAAAVARGVVVVVETHSSLLLRGIQTLVAKGVLQPGEVGLHWFQRDRDTGATTVIKADLDRRGAFGDWPEDFDDVALESESEYLDAAESAGVE